MCEDNVTDLMHTVSLNDNNAQCLPSSSFTTHLFC